MVRSHLRSRLHAVSAGTAQRLHRLPGREVEQVERLPLVRGEREVTFDHQALRDRRIARETELCGHLTFVHLAVA